MGTMKRACTNCDLQPEKTPVSLPPVTLLANANADALRRTGPTVLFLPRAPGVPQGAGCADTGCGGPRRAGAGSGINYAWSSRGRGLGNAYVWVLADAYPHPERPSLPAVHLAPLSPRGHPARISTVQLHISRELVNIGPAHLIVGSRHLRLVVSRLIRLGAPFAIVKLREFDRARTLYEKYLEDFARTLALFELGVAQSPLSIPELLWKAYIDFEIESRNNSMVVSVRNPHERRGAEDITRGHVCGVAIFAGGTGGGGFGRAGGGGGRVLGTLHGRGIGGGRRNGSR
ncbi:hypothetical protein C8J57DRAFT_1466247, partial [Mycena rebaudengoi]